MLLREGSSERISCGAFVRKAFVSSGVVASTQEVQAQGVDLDDVLYCSKLYRHAGRVRALPKLHVSRCCHNFSGVSPKRLLPTYAACAAVSCNCRHRNHDQPYLPLTVCF